MDSIAKVTFNISCEYFYVKGNQIILFYCHDGSASHGILHTRGLIPAHPSPFTHTQMTVVKQTENILMYARPYVSLCKDETRHFQHVINTSLSRKYMRNVESSSWEIRWPNFLFVKPYNTKLNLDYDEILLSPSRSVNQMQNEKRQQRMSSQVGIQHVTSIFEGTESTLWRAEKYVWLNCQIEPFYRHCWVLFNTIALVLSKNWRQKQGVLIFIHKDLNLKQSL